MWLYIKSNQKLYLKNLADNSLVIGDSVFRGKSANSAVRLVIGVKFYPSLLIPQHSTGDNQRERSVTVETISSGKAWAFLCIYGQSNGIPFIAKELNKDWEIIWWIKFGGNWEMRRIDRSATDPFGLESLWNEMQWV